MKTIFLHGLGQTCSSWEKTTAFLKKGADVLCPNLFDWFEGQTVNYPVLYHAFSEYCQQFPEPVQLCGLSLGGVLALHYSIEHPQHVHSLALIATPYTMPKRILKFQNMIFRFMPEKNFQSMGISKADFLCLTRSMMDLDFEKDLPRLSCPVLVLCGEKDTVNRSSSLGLQARLPKAEFRPAEKLRPRSQSGRPRSTGTGAFRFFSVMIH